MSRSGSRIPLLRLVWLALLAGAVVLRAHDPGLSTARLRLDASRLELELTFAPSDVRALLPPGLEEASSLASPAACAAVESPLQDLAPLLCRLQAGGATLAPSAIRTGLTPGDKVVLDLVFPRPSSAGLDFTAAVLAWLPAGHRTYLTVTDANGTLLEERMLQRATPSAAISLPAGAAPAASGHPAAFSFREFLVLGIEHIWTGYDHLLFLFGLLLVCRTLRSVAAIITCFTLAHSITLAVATLGWFDLSARIVEPAIAASIVFVGVENLLRGGDEPRWRWVLTFAFGLIHGFGFASVLRELGVGADGGGIVAPLFTFNLGVELGQLAVAAAVLPLLHRLRRHDLFLRRAVPALSALVALLGSYWLLERTLLSS